jgi:dienelactone hydrolase
MKPDFGIYHDILDAMVPKQPSLSFLTKSWPDIEAWRTRSRAKIFELMAFDPANVPLNASIDSKREEGSIVVEEISYDMPYGPRTQGFFLYPKRRRGKLPAVVALHDHGGFFYFGKEKVTSIPNEPSILRSFKKEAYGGRSWATELAKRGFAVLVPDVFLWGSRKIPIESINEEFQKLFEGLEPGSEEYVRKYNSFFSNLEFTSFAPTIVNAGTSWPGIFSYEDRRSVDYLVTRPEIDPNRIGCGGLSGGGLRTVFLSGLDSRIRCAFCVGFMSTMRGLLRNHIKYHGLFMYVPGLSHFLDLPDIIALRAPSPLMVQYDRDDEIFSLDGQSQADEKIAQIYAKIGHPENYVGKFYPGPHKFDIEMQNDAFEWLEKHLFPE